MQDTSRYFPPFIHATLARKRKANHDRLFVPFGGLRDIDLKPGETIIVAPATGTFGSAAVKVALAMGARVIAMGRNVFKLSARKPTSPDTNKIEIVPITNDLATDLAALQAFGAADAFFGYLTGRSGR